MIVSDKSWDLKNYYKQHLQIMIMYLSTIINYNFSIVGLLVVKPPYDLLAAATISLEEAVFPSNNFKFSQKYLHL